MPFKNLSGSTIGDIVITPEEQRVILDLIHSNLIHSTNIERYGRLTGQAIIAYDSLREMFCRFADNLGKSATILPYEWLSLGITSRISVEQISEFANPNGLVESADLHISQKAQYFLKKMKLQKS